MVQITYHCIGCPAQAQTASSSDIGEETNLCSPDYTNATRAPLPVSTADSGITPSRSILLIDPAYGYISINRRMTSENKNRLKNKPENIYQPAAANKNRNINRE